MRKYFSLAVTAAVLFGYVHTATAGAMTWDESFYEMTKSPYAKQGDWEVEYFNEKGGDFAYCQATKIFAQETALRFTMQESEFTVDFMGEASGALGDSFPVSYWVDAPDIKHEEIAALVEDPEKVEWARFTETNEEPGIADDALLNGKVFNIQSGKQKWTYSLEQAKPVLESLFKCNDEHRGAGVSADDAGKIEKPAASAQDFRKDAEGREVNCSLKVKGKTYLKGTCMYEADKDGSFRLFGDKYFVYLNMLEKGVASASWNGTAQSSGADELLGEDFKRKGGCWVGKNAEICALNK